MLAVLADADDGGVFGFLRHIEAVTQHHGGGKNGADRVCKVLTRNVRCRAVDRLVQAAARRTEARGRDHADGAYIKRLGGESSYTGAVGTDSFGKIMISAIQNKGVDTSHIQVLDGKTAVTHVDIVDGDRVFGKYEEGVLADFKLREQDISFIKKHDLAVTGIWGMIEDELPLISKEIPVAFDFANKFANPIVEKAIPYVTYAFFSFDEESRNEFRQKYHSMGLKEKENCTEQLKEFMKAMQQKGPKVIIATLGKNGSIGYDGNSWYRFGIIECKVVDTMGAGDSFIAGFLYGILNGLNVQDSMEAGAQNSAVTIGYQGAW